jgi:hypothetical protein
MGHRIYLRKEAKFSLLVFLSFLRDNTRSAMYNEIIRSTNKIINLSTG